MGDRSQIEMNTKLAGDENCQERCETCIYFHTEEDRHECLRYPPNAIIYIVDGRPRHASAYPAVNRGDWCGEWAG